MNNNLKHALQLDQILTTIAEYTHSDLAANALKAAPISSNLTQVQTELQLTSEAHQLLANDVQLQFFNLDQLTVIKRKLDQGRLLNVEQLNTVLACLTNWQRIKIVLNKFATITPKLNALVATEVPLKGLRSRLDEVLDGHGIRDSATPQLAELRLARKKQTKKIQTLVSQFVARHGHEVQSHQLIVRDQHYCVQLKANYKHRFPGTVLGQSATGATVYFEPGNVTKNGSELATIVSAEDAEVYQILATLTGDLVDHWAQLERQVGLLSRLDQIFARGRYGLEHRAIVPHVNTDQHVKIVNGRHPLLGAGAVPLNVELPTQRSLMITGANSGGKTVVLKTIALFALMIKVGLELPADADTDLACFDQILIDIGDQQNMAAQLSTFSGEMTTLVNITSHLRPNALILLDEIGSGTDPEEGAALGIAVIDYLIKHQAKLIVTTHYSDIKQYAVRQPDFITGAMAFDRQSLRPEYRLLLNQVGESEAMWLAAKLGLKTEILRTARQQLEHR